MTRYTRRSARSFRSVLASFRSLKCSRLRRGRVAERSPRRSGLVVGVSVYLSVLLPASTCSAGDTESQPQSISSATARYFEPTREDRDSLRGGRSAKLASRRKNITNACCMAYDILTVVSSFRTYHRPRPPILPIRASFSASGDQKTTARPGYEADEAGTSTTSESSWYVPAAFCYQRPCRTPGSHCPPLRSRHGPLRPCTCQVEEGRAGWTRPVRADPW